MKTQILIILLLGLFTINSCDSLNVDLNNTLSDDKYYKNEEQLAIALNGVYATLSETYLYGNFMLGRLGLDADEGYNYYSSDVSSSSQNYVTPSDVKILSYWRRVYEGINKANLLLENIDKSTEAESTRNKIKGQAMFLRAYYYSMLVTRFGDVPLVLKLPRSGNADDVQIPQTSSREIYNFIISEMSQAADLVSDIDAVESTGRVSKSVVWGMLSRMCLYMAGNPINDTNKYADAAFWAKKVIDSNKHSLNNSYQQLYINYAQDLYDKKESMWEVEFYGNNSGTYTTTAGVVGRNIGIYNIADDNIGYCAGYLRSSSVLYDLYNASGNDLRRDWAIAPYYYSGNPGVKKYWKTSDSKFQCYCGKFRREYEILTPKSKAATPQNYPLLRYADVLLMYAEAVTMKENKTKNEIDSAYWAINQVRRRAYGLDVYTPNVTVDLNDQNTSDLLKEIQNERSRELCFECLRKNDLIRWGIYYDKMKYTLSKVPSGSVAYITYAKSYYANVNTRDILWPIPTYEMGLNKFLKQNQGW